MSPLRLDLDGEALAANWRWLRDRNPGAACGAAIKADGYGLGARGVLTRLAVAGARDFFVATWDEAVALGALPEGVDVAVLHGVRAEDIAVARDHPARPVLNSIEQVARWKAAGGGDCDVMVDTGINRLGLTIAEAQSGALDGLAIDTLHSHLACAEEADHPLNALQRARFAAVRATAPARRYSLANSAGTMLGADYAADLVRPGLAVYGGRPAAGMEAIRAVATPQAQVVQRKPVGAGEGIGYGASFVAPSDMTIAILNIGYADGYFRAFAGSGAAWADEVRCPLIGRVSMDLIAVDIGAADVAEGDWLRIDHDLPAAAAATGLSQYELLTGLGTRYQRRWT